MDDFFIKQYVDLLIIQYFNKIKARAEMEVIIGSAFVVYLWLKSFQKEFDLDEAWGNRLDILGRIVGINRTVEEGLAKKYFSWNDGFQLEPRTFGEAPFFDLIKSPGFTPTQLDDAQMRFFIRAKAIKNATSAYLSHSDKIDLQDAIQYLFRSRAIILDNYNMSMSIYIDDTIPTEDIILLLKQNLLPKPQGVRLILYKYNPDHSFSFAGTPGGKTFGQGSFAQIIAIPE